jgi:DNA-directed RNA polymerase sigma subunit (sigma70/sigma32)
VSKQTAKVDRDALICDRYLHGETLQEIGPSLAISAERVRQIVRQAGLTVADCGRAVREAAAKADAS